MWKLRHQEAGAALWLDQGRAKVASEHRSPWAFARRAQRIQGGTPPEPRPLSFMQPVLDDPVVIARPVSRPAEIEALPGVMHALAPAPTSREPHHPSLEFWLSYPHRS